MTEEEWLASNSPYHMLRVVRGKVSERKLRLFAVACCYRMWPLIMREESRVAVEVAARFADGLASPEELESALRAAPYYEGHFDPDRSLNIHAHDAAFGCAINHEKDDGPDRPPIEPAFLAADCVLNDVRAALLTTHDGKFAPYAKNRDAAEQEQAAQAVLARDIFGNPFRPASVNPSWLNSTVIGLAKTIYDDRAFDRLPILADALEEAGCTNAELLEHCRGPGPHVRGCWVVDLLVGKE